MSLERLQKDHWWWGEPIPFALFKGRERAALAPSEPLDTLSSGLGSREHFFNETTLLPSPQRKIWQKRAVHTHPPLCVGVTLQ